MRSNAGPRSWPIPHFCAYLMLRWWWATAIGLTGSTTATLLNERLPHLTALIHSGSPHSPREKRGNESVSGWESKPPHRWCCLRDVVQATALLRSQGVPAEVLVAGSGPLEADMREAAQEAKVPLHLLGFCNQTEMPAAYAAADLLVLPSTGRETWGLVANEALACGKPIVVSDAAGCAQDLATDGLAGRVFRCGDTAALASALADVLRAPPSPEAIRARSDSHGLPAAANGIEAALKACVAAKAAGGWQTRPTRRAGSSR
jgi:Glycosyl transferases group 1